MRLSWLWFARFRVWTETSVITGMSHEGATVDGTRAPGRERYGRRRGAEAKASNRQDHSPGYGGDSHVGAAPQPGFIGAGGNAAGQTGHRDAHAYAVQEAIRLLEDAVPVGLPGGFAEEIAQGHRHVFDFHELQKGRHGKAEAAKEPGNQHGVNHRKQTGPP